MGLGDICRSFCVFWCVVVVWERLQMPPPSLGLGALVYRVFLGVHVYSYWTRRIAAKNSGLTGGGSLGLMALSRWAQLSCRVMRAELRPVCWSCP